MFTDQYLTLVTRGHCVDTRGMQIDRVSGLTPAQFHAHYVTADTPVIITDLVSEWPSRHEFTLQSLKARYGDLDVDIEMLSEDKAGDAAFYWDDLEIKSRLLRDYVHLIETEDVGSQAYLAQYPVSYFPDMSSFIKPIPYYSQLITRITRNEPLLWLGPKGAVSALHYDPMHNFVVQLEGSKRWTIFPSSQHELLYIPSPTHHEFSPIDLQNPDLDAYPRLAEADRTEFSLRAGEVLFLPMRWPHHVLTESNAVTLNFWWTTWADLFTRGPGYVGRRIVGRIKSLFA